MKLLVTLTWSKIMAFTMLACAVIMGSQTFMFAVPFISALILGKQYFDKGKPAAEVPEITPAEISD